MKFSISLSSGESVADRPRAFLDLNKLEDLPYLSFPSAEPRFIVQLSRRHWPLFNDCDFVVKRCNSDWFNSLAEILSQQLYRNSGLTHPNGSFDTRLIWQIMIISK
ncbi:hypothetical protein HI914_00984 [Erysiphe necator]|nr:hypothetical protein HI914_00984 [Erysiphe necator]